MNLTKSHFTTLFVSIIALPLAMVVMTSVWDSVRWYYEFMMQRGYDSKDAGFAAFFAVFAAIFLTIFTAIGVSGSKGRDNS